MRGWGLFPQFSRGRGRNGSALDSDDCSYRVAERLEVIECRIDGGGVERDRPLNNIAEIQSSSSGVGEQFIDREREPGVVLVDPRPARPDYHAEPGQRRGGRFPLAQDRNQTIFYESQPEESYCFFMPDPDIC